MVDGMKVEISIQLLPGRKRKALVLTVGHTTRPLAYFVDEDAVQDFLRYQPRHLDE